MSNLITHWPTQERSFKLTSPSSSQALPSFPSVSYVLPYCKNYFLNMPFNEVGLMPGKPDISNRHLLILQFFWTLNILFKPLTLDLSFYIIIVWISIFSLDCKPSSAGTVSYSSFYLLSFISLPSTTCLDYNLYSIFFNCDWFNAFQQSM